MSRDKLTWYPVWLAAVATDGFARYWAGERSGDSVLPPENLRVRTPSEITGGPAIDVTIAQDSMISLYDNRVGPLFVGHAHYHRSWR